MLDKAMLLALADKVIASETKIIADIEAEPGLYPDPDGSIRACRGIIKSAEDLRASVLEEE